MDTYGHVWTRMDTYGHVWTRMDTYGHVWTRMDTYGHVCILPFQKQFTYGFPYDHVGVIPGKKKDKDYAPIVKKRQGC